MPATQTIMCAKCRVPLTGPDSPTAATRFACPKCGSGDTYDRILTELADRKAEGLQDALFDGLKKAFGNSKNVKITHSRAPQRAKRFYLG